MVIEGNRKNQGHYEEQDQNVIVIRADDQQEEKADQQDDNLRGDDVGQYCAYKEAVLPLKQGHAVGTMMANVEGLINNP